MPNNETHPDEAHRMVNLSELACLCGLRPRIIHRLVTLEIIEPDRREPEPRFGLTVVERVRKMRRLHVELGVSWLSMPLVLELLERIEQLEAERRTHFGAR